MNFWKRRKKRGPESSTPVVTVRRSGASRRFAVEMKLLAARAKEAGLGPKEVADLIGASAFSASKWRKLDWAMPRHYRNAGATMPACIAAGRL